MMNKLIVRTELAANVAIIIVSLLLAGILIRRYIVPVPIPEGNVSEPLKVEDNALIGKQMSLADVDWAGNRATLVLALQAGCHFCSESAPFYQRILKENSTQGKTQIVAVLPQNVDVAQGYLGGLGVSINQVKQASLNSIGVKGTPTLLLVDSNGMVKNSWVGKLTPDRELEVTSALFNQARQ